MTSAQRKLMRGVEHVKTLRREAGSYVDEDPYVFRTEPNAESGYAIVYRCFAVERKAPLDHWPLLAGEAVQNLRSALDHAVYATASRRGREKSQFPIFTDPCEFQVLGSRMLPGVSKSIRTLIEGAQPYNASEQAPARDRLELLRTLSNVEKHRTLATVACAIHHEWIGIRPDIEVFFQEFATNKPLGQSQAEVEPISVFTARAETEFKRVDVNPNFTYEVRVEGMPIAAFVSIAQRVFEIVTEIETGEPISPGAAYPIYPALPGEHD